jgi:hypothetical protein
MFEKLPQAARKRSPSLAKSSFAAAAKTKPPQPPLVQPRYLRNRRFRLIDDFEAHLAGRAGDDAEAGVVVACVEIFALGVHDVHDLFARDLADLRLVRFFGTGGDVGRLLQQDSGRRAFRDERKRFIFVNRDHDRQNVACLFLSSGVKFFAERHDVHASWA